MKRILTGLTTATLSTIALAHEGDHSGETLSGLVHHSLFDADHLLMLLGGLLVIGSSIAMFLRSQKKDQASDEHSD